MHNHGARLIDAERYQEATDITRRAVHIAVPVSAGTMPRCRHPHELLRVVHLLPLETEHSMSVILRRGYVRSQPSGLFVVGGTSFMVCFGLKLHNLMVSCARGLRSMSNYNMQHGCRELRVGSVELHIQHEGTDSVRCYLAAARSLTAWPMSPPQADAGGSPSQARIKTSAHPAYMGQLHGA